MPVNTARVNTPATSRPTTGRAYLDAILDQPGSVVAMAHRGGAEHPELLGAENTLHAFEHAVALGYRYLETDVHATADGVLLAFHDDVLDRVTDTRGLIASMTADEVSHSRIGGLHAIPTMQELLERFPDTRFNIDLKSPGAVRPLVDLLARTGAEDRVCVGSFSRSRLQAFRNGSGGRVATSASPAEVAAFVTTPSRAARSLTRGRVDALQVPHRVQWRGLSIPVVTASLVGRAHAAGMHVHVWTIDDPTEMTHLLDLGVDGLITDRTDVLKDVLISRGQWRDHP